jgi:hypothetical protein
MVQALYYQIKCGRGSTAIAQGKAHATRALNAGATLSEAKAVMLRNAEAKGVPLKGKDGRASLEAAYDTQVQIGKARLELDRAEEKVKKVAKELSNYEGGRDEASLGKAFRLRGELETAKRGVDVAKRKIAGLKGEQVATTKSVSALGKPVSIKEANRPLSDGERMRVKAYIGNYRNVEQKKEFNKIAETLNKATGGNVSGLDAAVIKKYTNTNYYISANETLKGAESSKSLQTKQAQLAYAKQLNQSIQKIPPYRGEVFRNAPISAKDNANLYQVGKTVQWNGMTSTSKSNVTAYGDISGKPKLQKFISRSGDTYTGIAHKGNHAVANYREYGYKDHGFKPRGSADDVPVTFRINTKSGRDISSIGRTGDNEVIIPHGFKGKVTRREGNTIYIDEV